MERQFLYWNSSHWLGTSLESAPGTGYITFNLLAPGEMWQYNFLTPYTE